MIIFISTEEFEIVTPKTHTSVTQQSSASFMLLVGSRSQIKYHTPASSFYYLRRWNAVTSWLFLTRVGFWRLVTSFVTRVYFIQATFLRVREAPPPKKNCNSYHHDYGQDIDAPHDTQIKHWIFHIMCRIILSFFIFYTSLPSKLTYEVRIP